jgi:hypothetical protein
MRVKVLQPFQGRRDGATSRQPLGIGEEITLDPNDPHTATLIAGGYAAEIKTAQAKAEKVEPAPKPVKPEKPAKGEVA